MTSPGPVEIRRRRDGSIDIPSYIVRAHSLRNVAIRGTFVAMGRFLIRSWESSSTRRAKQTVPAAAQIPGKTCRLIHTVTDRSASQHVSETDEVSTRKSPSPFDPVANSA
jgi:hypothetical protein